jgi:Tol biopolymer transport system component
MRLLTPARGRATRRALPGAAVAVVLAAFGGAVAPGAADAATQPGDRAYELVSSFDSGGLDVANRIGGQAVVAGSAGGAALLTTLGTSPGGQASDLGTAPLIARRTATGWDASALAPALTPGVLRPDGFSNGSVSYATRDLSSVLISTNQPMVTGAATDVLNLFRRTVGEAPALVAAPASLEVTYPPLVIGMSADGRSALFGTPDLLTPDALPTGNMNLYLARDGHVELANVDDSGVPTAGVDFNQPTNGFQNVLSEDGRTLFFQSIDNGQLYVRRDGVSTMLSRPQGGTSGTPTFYYATPDGSKVVFKDSAPLTPDSSAGGRDLYLYDVASDHLTVLTANPDVTTAPVGISDDGSTVYFASRTPAMASDTPVGAQRELFVWRDGTRHFAGDIGLTPSSFDPYTRSIDITADGRHALFSSTVQSNTASPLGGTRQLFVYDADTGTRTCVSCRPDGTTPTASVQDFGAGVGTFQTFIHALPNALSADGRRAVFATTDALSPRDVNNANDVYEWTPDGVTLISDGTDPNGSQLGDMSPDGTDLYFTTRDPLLAQDDDDDNDLYDARLGGGLPAPAVPTDTATCGGDACQGEPTPVAPIPGAGTIAFSGPGNTTEDASVPKEPAVVKATRGAVHGGRFTLKVRTPGAGRISVSGTHVTTVRRTAAKAETYTLTVTLNAAAKRSLARHHTLKVSVKVGFVPSTQKSSTATLSLTVKA